MSDQQQQQQPNKQNMQYGHATSIPIYNTEQPSERGKHIKAVLDELETKQLDTLDDAGKSGIERIATFLGVLFAVTVLSNNFPPPYLKGNLPAKIMIITSLVCFLLSIGSGLMVTLIRSHNRYNRLQKNVDELAGIIRWKLFWNRSANILFALGTIALAGLLIVIIWNL